MAGERGAITGKVDEGERVDEGRCHMTREIWQNHDEKAIC